MAEPQWYILARQAEQHRAQKHWAEATKLAQQSLDLEPRCALAHQVLGLIDLQEHRLQDAMARLRQALETKPDLTPAHNALGRCHMVLGEMDRAEWHFNRALCLQPDYPFAHFNRAAALLKRGQYRDGWIEYEWRFACGLVARTPIPRPRWDGSPLNGRSILVHTEQGMGDVLQFIRFLPLLKRQASRLVFACQTPMQRLLRNLPCVDRWFPIGQPGEIDFDVYSPLLSLPALLEIDEKSIPQPIPYVLPEDDLSQQWRQKLSRFDGFKVGICWQGSPTFEGDYWRSIPLKYFAPLAKVESVKLLSLQTGAGVEQIQANHDLFSVQELGDLDSEGAFVDRAAILQNIDLLVTSDTSVAHLAGAMGRPVWVALSTASDWRWLSDRTDSPWYPSMRLFRQTTLGDWPAVFEQVAEALRSLSLDRCSGKGLG